MVGQNPTHFQGCHWIATPHDDQIAFLQNDRPGGLLAVYLHIAHHMRHDDLACTGGVVTHCGGVTSINPNIS